MVFRIELRLFGAFSAQLRTQIIEFTHSTGNTDSLHIWVGLAGWAFRCSSLRVEFGDLILVALQPMFSINPVVVGDDIGDLDNGAIAKDACLLILIVGLLFRALAGLGLVHKVSRELALDADSSIPEQVILSADLFPGFTFLQLEVVQVAVRTDTFDVFEISRSLAKNTMGSVPLFSRTHALSLGLIDRNGNIEWSGSSVALNLTRMGCLVEDSRYGACCTSLKRDIVDFFFRA